jgi:hypothetical protein
MKRVLVWLDDYRDPAKDTDGRYKMASKKIEHDEVVWIKSHDEFVAFIESHGMPHGISFDHDLADEHYQYQKVHLDWHSREDVPIPYEDYKEKTGMTSAKWLIEHCLDNLLPLPEYFVHSGNPSGAKNIQSILDNFKNFTES